ncbi:sulfite exporter TauE/SafE family protein [Rubrobacter aplysinae]|uniref:sulfite exporter TauE/SafE family protein n=1 Tax=Rubrobacter aplysinae TaxID=909625 RepID=UPI00069FE236|nr:sulfite exporter TauE/SafE family protein [Rubrobacter aplysinae]
MIDLLPTLFGLLVGFLVGLTGVGGGALMTPFLIAVVGVSAPTAIGTDLVFATLTKMAGSVQHYRQRSVNLEVALFLGLGSIPASLLGVATLEWIKGSFEDAAVNSIMITIIGLVLILVGGSLVFRIFMPERWMRKRQDVWSGEGKMSRRRRYYTILFGAMGGYLVGLTSVGAGSIMAIILLLLYPLSPAVIVGTDIVHATVLALVTGLAHIASGNVAFGLAGTLLIGSIPGVLIGSRVARYVPSKPLRLILAVMVTVVGFQLIFGGH